VSRSGRHLAYVDAQGTPHYFDDHELFFFQIQTRSIHPSAEIGLPPEMRDYKPGHKHHGVIVHEEARIGAFCTIDAGYESPTRIGKCWLMKHVHVGHDAIIGDGVEIAPHTSVGGYVVIGNNVKVGQSAVFKPYVVVGEGAVIGMGAVVTKNVPAGETWVGNPASKMEKRPQHKIEHRESDDNMWSRLYGRTETEIIKNPSGYKPGVNVSGTPVGDTSWCDDDD
jgi:UDP-3-O-[3-hydroxymyristoyl] glucosamine N-acyltransferase